jgi:AraC-like DNA-binding protein
MLQIALACGFSNQSHFNRVFKKLTGVTPGTYRKSRPG